MAGFDFTIKDTLGTVDKTGLEVHLIQYGNYNPKLDVRHWFFGKTDGVKRMAKGVTLTKDEAIALRDMLIVANLEKVSFEK